MEDIKIINNLTQSRFETTINGETALLEYKYYKNNIAFMHTYVPQYLEGKGIGTKLVIAAIDFAIQQNKKMMFYCSFVLTYVKQHKELYKYVDTDLHPAFKVNSAT